MHDGVGKSLSIDPLKENPLKNGRWSSNLHSWGWKTITYVPMGGIPDQDKDKPSNQQSKALNQETKAVISMFMSPRAMGETMVVPGLLVVLDSGEG